MKSTHDRLREALNREQPRLGPGLGGGIVPQNVAAGIGRVGGGLQPANTQAGPALSAPSARHDFAFDYSTPRLRLQKPAPEPRQLGGLL